MKAIILTIGDELLNGDTIDTNSSWIARQLSLLGIEPLEIRSIADNKTAILNAFTQAMNTCELTICTGGLGPTNDDLTKECFANYFNVELEEDANLRNRLERYYVSRGYKKEHVSEKMVSFPKGTTLLENNFGVAPGMWQEKNGRVMICLPGIPYEMKGIFREQIIPKLNAEFALPVIRYHYFMTAGKGETHLAKRLQGIEQNLPAGISISYLPSFANVKVRLSAKGNSSELITQFEELIPQIREQLQPETYSETRNASLVDALAELCAEHNVTIGTVESCTGGAIAKSITSKAGSSQYFLGSIISYANEVKEQLVGVRETTLAKHGAVSEQTIKEMVAGGLQQLNSDYVVATSGIAGPSGGSKEKPVGLVWIGVGNTKTVRAKSFTFAKKRTKNIQLFTMMALNELFQFIKEQESI